MTDADKPPQLDLFNDAPETPVKRRTPARTLATVRSARLTQTTSVQVPPQPQPAPAFAKPLKPQPASPAPLSEFENPARLLLDVRAAATRLNVSASFLNKLRCYGGGPPFVKIGSAVRYAVGDIEAWAASRRRTSTSDPGTSD